MPVKKTAASKSAAAVKATKTTVKKTTAKPVLDAVLLWDDNATLAKASVAIKKHLADNDSDLIKTGATVKDIASFRKSKPFWAQAKKGIVRAGQRLVQPGEWLIAFDTPADGTLEGKTYLFTRTGQRVYAVAPDDVKLDSFDYYEA